MGDWKKIALAATLAGACTAAPEPPAAAPPRVLGRAEAARAARPVVVAVPDGPTCEAQPGEVAQPRTEQEVLLAAWERAALASAQGGWPQVPASAVDVRAGQRHEAVGILRERLHLEGYPVHPSSEVAAPDLLDSSLTAALRLYQQDHQIPPTGLPDRETLRALDVPASRRGAQLRRALVLLEHTAGAPTRVRVNIPAYEAVLYVEGAPLMRARAVVGAPYRNKTGGMTREMSGAVHTVVAHPPWIPTQSFIDEILAAEERRQPGAAARRGLVPIRRQSGRLGYSMAPGPDNPLGRLVLRFNPEGSPLAVFYLHDTPERHRFEEAWRAHSSGCVRVQHIEDLAAAVADLGGLDPASLRSALGHEGKTTVMRVPRPVPVHVEYSTADVGPGGRVRYHPDVYRLDPAILPSIAAR